MRVLFLNDFAWLSLGRLAESLACSHCCTTSLSLNHVDRERIAPSPPTQTGQAVLPHPAFQFVVDDGLAQALDSKASEESRQPRRLSPRSPVSQAVHCQVAVELQARFSGASGRTALRHYPDPFGMEFQRRPPPRPCPPSLHGRYSLHRYYEDSDPDRPVRHRPWFPDSRHLNFQTFHLQPSAVLPWTRSTPSTPRALFCSGFAVCSAGSPEPPTESSSPGPVLRTLLRTVRSLPVALHPGVSPRRSYFQLLALQCRPGQGLSPCSSSALSGARSAAILAAAAPRQTRRPIPTRGAPIPIGCGQDGRAPVPSPEIADMRFTRPLIASLLDKETHCRWQRTAGPCPCKLLRACRAARIRVS